MFLAMQYCCCWAGTFGKVTTLTFKTPYLEGYHMYAKLIKYLQNLSLALRGQPAPAERPGPAKQPAPTPSKDVKLIKYLQKLDLFKDTPETVLAKIAGHTTTRNLAKGDILVRKGEPSDSLFVIRTGWVKVIAKSDKGEEMMLNQCGPGQIIGEMSLIDQEPRSNSMAALSPAQVLEIKYDIVLDVLHRHPVLAISFLNNMFERVRFANAYIEETVIWSEHIAAGDYNFVQKQLAQTQSTIVDMNLSHQARASAFLSSFFKMVEEVKGREENLKQQVQQLTIEIDEVKRQQTVAELTETDFFENLQVAAQKMRQKRDAKAKKRPGQGKAKEE